MRKHRNILNYKSIYSRDIIMTMIYVTCDSIMAKVDIKQDNCKMQSQQK
jgi:hypothetical protein